MPANDVICVAELVGWMRSKGLTEMSPGMLLEDSFADGRLLCRLVGLLERRTLTSVEWRTPSIAAARHNTAKVHILHQPVCICMPVAFSVCLALPLLCNEVNVHA